MKAKKKSYEKIAPSNRTEFAMLYYSSLRTLNAIRVHLKQTIGEHSYYSGRITSLNHKLEQMVACHKRLREDFKTYAESHKHKN